MTMRATVAATVALLRRQGASEPVVKLTDHEAVALALELGDTCRHVKALPAAEAFKATLEAPRPVDTATDAELEAWISARGRDRRAFWDEFEGEPVEGGTISRLEG